MSSTGRGSRGGSESFSNSDSRPPEGIRRQITSDRTKSGLILFLVLASYSPSLFCGFIWDDDAGIVENPDLRSLSGLREIWANPWKTPQGHYQPLVYSSFWLEYQLWGLRPVGYHLVNVLLHAANAILLWGLLRRIGLHGAWPAAALFAVHPVNAESVVWIIERKNVLSGLFFLLCLRSYIRFAERRTPGAYHWALFFFCCALLAKISVITLPAVLLLGLWRGENRLGWKAVGPVLPLGVIGLVFGWFEVRLAQAHEVTDHGLSIADRVLTAGRAFWFYLGKWVCPVDLAAVYPKWEIDPRVVWNWIAPLAALILGAVLWRVRKRVGSGPFCAWAYVLVTLSPTLGFVDFGFMALAYIADRFLYLPSMGLAALSGAAIRGAERKIGRASTAALLSALLVVPLSVLTWRQAWTYRNQETLVRHNLENYPEAWLVRYNFAIDLAASGRIEGAIEHYRGVIKTRPSFIDARNNLGTLLARAGKAEEAEREFEEILKIDPGYAKARFNLGVLAARRGDREKAAGHYRGVLELDPGNEEAKRLLAELMAGGERE